MDPIKESFKKVKEDILSLRFEIEQLKTQINEFFLNNDSTNRQVNPTDRQTTSTHKHPLEAANNQNLPISTGNQGVPTDRQTNRQTNRHTPISHGDSISSESMDDALEILNSLDSVKKGIRLKFKNLTDQEFLVFSTIYQFDEEFGYSDYKTLAKALNLSESSVRDYVGRIMKKGISVEKRKIHNKNVQILISQNLKKAVSLNTIMQLRDL